jgi:hypothetical protein
MPRTEVPITDVREAVRKYVSLPGDSGVFELFYGTLRQVGDLAGLDRSLGDSTTWEHQRDWNKFCSQVKREFDKLAAEGTLRKAGSGTAGPDGQTLRRNEVRYYTPEAWETRARQYAEACSQGEHLAARWAAVHDQLAELHMASTAKRGTHPRLGVEHWEDLLLLAKQGQLAQDELSAAARRR